MKKLGRLAEEILVSVCETEEVLEDKDMDLFESGFIDSFSILSIILEIESKLGVRLQPTDIERKNLSTVHHFISFLEEREGAGK